MAARLSVGVLRVRRAVQPSSSAVFLNLGASRLELPLVEISQYRSLFLRFISNPVNTVQGTTHHSNALPHRVRDRASRL
jgi:hypothetical protein